MPTARVLVKKWLQEQWKASGLTKVDFGKAIGIDNKSTITGILSGPGNVTLEHLDGIARWKRVPLSVLLRELSHAAFDAEGAVDDPPAAAAPHGGMVPIPGGYARPAIAKAINEAAAARREASRRTEEPDEPAQRHTRSTPPLK